MGSRGGVGMVVGVALALAWAGRAAGDDGRAGGGTHRLPGGVVVELVGVGAHRADPPEWWNPSGGRLAEPPYARTFLRLGSRDGAKDREFAVRVSGAPEGSYSVAIEAEGALGSGVSTPRDADGRDVPGLTSFAAALPGDRATATLRVSVAAGAWSNRAVCGPRGLDAQEFEGTGVAFGEARALGEGRVVISVAHGALDEDSRLLLLGANGLEHTPRATRKLGSGDVWLTECEFDLSPRDIRGFAFQTRPWSRIEFAEVPLDPAPDANGDGGPERPGDDGPPPRALAASGRAR